MTEVHEGMIKLPVSIIRGGTSKGVYILEEDLPKDKNEWDAVLLRMMGSPDRKQIDGLGGSQSVTSKVAIIKKSERPDADVDYTFAQVSVDKPIVSYKGNCGNISSGVGPFAIEKGLVEAREGTTSVRIYNTNTDKIIVGEVSTKNGEVKYEGDFAIAGVPGTASPIKLKFVDPSGTLGNGLLPTGNVVDVLEVPGYGKVEVSIVDAANPLVFAKAVDLGLKGGETPDEINGDEEKLDLLEKVRGLAAVKLGLISDYTKSAWETPGIPKMTFVAEAADYTTADGKALKKSDIDLLSRMMSMQKAHPSYAMTGAMCTAAAAVIKGSIVNQVLSKDTDTQFIRIGHASGVLECGVDYVEDAENKDVPKIDDTFGFRTANLIMEGKAVIRL
ncbi:3-methylitaconate isomerase [Oribacterium sp. C9]|uniref:2-methylaconitate cis-trans isomerase PrpF family protein n=1 Tax=Oribacterium sp. C9 TaxID=1943579 RepID=UPI00098F6245|nr:PrpF domain-containing protein [Oribacterium sp. C9]OON86247.1 3-methylitaconate isomerase [Oribacterium sp. C9]